MISIPTLNQLYQQIKADLEGEYSITIPTFGKTILRVIAIVQAGKLKLYYLAIGLLQKNIFVDTADPEAIGGTLERFGRVKLGRNPFPAQAGQYTLTVTGQVGAVIPTSTTFKSNDDALNPSKIYQLDQAHTLVSATDTIQVRALEAGIGSKLQVGDELTATAPIALVDSLAIVAGEVIQPLAAETIEEYRRKAIEAYQLEPQGGAASDYIIWASDAQGVSKSYPYAKSGDSNVIDLFIEATVADSIDGKGTPSTATLSDVEAVVNFDPDSTKPLYERGRRPLGVFKINYLPVTIKNVDVEITNYQGLTPEIQTQIFNALKDALSRIRPFVSAADVVANKNDIISTPRLSFVVQLAVPSSIYDSIEFAIDGNPYASYVFTQGNIPYLNSVTYV